ncbi:Emp24/gp25L/p24 family protein [Cooperia oncophora]
MAEHYVEMIHSFVLVNVPSFISAVWTVARPLLPEKTRLKGTHLSWELHANGHFSFTIYEVNKDEETDDLSKMKMLYPLFSKVPGPTMVPFGDSLPVEKTGVYRFWFGNQHAWFHTLRVHHIIKSEK